MTTSGTNNEAPLNREPPGPELISKFYTDVNIAYDRNHGNIPALSSETHQINVCGLIENPFTMIMKTLDEGYARHTVTCALQCAGNRRHTMRTTIKDVDGIDWNDSAVMNCEWEGVRLVDILSDAGVDKKAKHVQFACHSVDCQDDTWYGASIPIDYAMRADAEIILATRQNGKVLTPEHGFPVRVIVPGIAGARSVKWLDEIRVTDEESPNFYQRRDYKILPPEAVDKEAAAEFWDKVPALMKMPINSVIIYPEKGSKVSVNAARKIEIGGYALPAGEHGPIVKVEVRIDNGEWHEAQLLDGSKPNQKWCWCLWKWEDYVSHGKHKIWSRATDKGGNQQVSERSAWNLRGVAYNGYGETDIEVFSADD
jgi:sulfite oxidase